MIFFTEGMLSWSKPAVELETHVAVIVISAVKLLGAT